MVHTRFDKYIETMSSHEQRNKMIDIKTAQGTKILPMTFTITKYLVQLKKEIYLYCIDKIN